MGNPKLAEAGGTTNRRAFVRGAVATAALPFLSALRAGRAAGAGPEQPTRPADDSGFPGLIVREAEPLNLEFPFPTLDSFLTPNPRFYVRNHFAMPNLEVRDWRLKVEGAVERPLELTYDDLLKMAPRTQTALLECAGNGRVFLTPKASGVQWELGAASNAEWAGVPLAAVLDRAGVRGAAVEVVLEGADAGEIRDEPKSPGKISFVRSLPLEKARKPEVLLAHKMNGEDLPAAHGFPVRAVVPGWYGMASVKWLTRIVVTDRPFQGYFQSLSYTSFERVNGLPSMVPVRELEVKSEVARPVRGEVVAAGADYRVHGAAWTGESEVAKVEVSTDGGKSWAEARLLGEATPFAWRLWEHAWSAPEKGRTTVTARATDKKGRTQAEKHDPDRRAYRISHVLPVEVEVR